MSTKGIHERDTMVILPMKHICSFVHDILNSAGNGDSLWKLPSGNFIKSWILSLKLSAELREKKSWRKHYGDNLNTGPCQTHSIIVSWSVTKLSVVLHRSWSAPWGGTCPFTPHKLLTCMRQLQPFLSFQVTDICQRTQQNLTKGPVAGDNTHCAGRDQIRHLATVPSWVLKERQSFLGMVVEDPILDLTQRCNLYEEPSWLRWHKGGNFIRHIRAATALRPVCPRHTSQPRQKGLWMLRETFGLVS